MNESANSVSEATSTELVKPVQHNDDIKFPPFPDPSDDDFEDDISEEERSYYKGKFPDLNAIKSLKLHCTACDRHLGCSARNEARMRSHPLLRTLVCNTCHTFYNSGEFEKGDDGSELYCRWCGQGGQVYCCSDCCHVFCAKCIKRNFGMPKIKEIENTDDWKCFKCNNKCLWDMRAVCWALLRYCDLKNKITYKTMDSDLKDAYQKDLAIDHSECCKNKTNKRKERSDLKKKDVEKKEAEKKEAEKKELENSSKRAAAVVAMSKIPPTIQVKKFASINPEINPDIKLERKAQKRSASPKKFMMKNPITIASGAKLLNPINLPPMPKKMRGKKGFKGVTPLAMSIEKMPNATMINPIRVLKDRPSMNSYTRIKPKIPQMPLMLNNFNGFQNPGMFSNMSNMAFNDNINLSLESLTQGLDMAAVASMSTNHRGQDDDLVCTPDFPLEPLCEVTEDNDDDVQCMTPAPIMNPKINTPPPPPPPPPPLVSRSANIALPDLSSDNIIQMTENDVTVNAATGGLKFRVDPQTLSSNKMYRLPDGRIFAINTNPNMPGGYSATIVAVTENTANKTPIPKGTTYAAKLSAVTPAQSTPNRKPNKTTRSSTSKRHTPKPTKTNKNTDNRQITDNRDCDLNVPVEWFRYNLIDASDALEYSMSRVQKMKKEATTMYLRTRTVDEMKNLHRQLDRLLNTSSTRFREIRESLNKEMKLYISKKEDGGNVSEDDDVEILNDVGDNNDDPIFIDENSMDLNVNESNVNDTQEVDLTDVASSEHNDSIEKSMNHKETCVKDPLARNSEIDESSITDNTTADDEMNTNEDEYILSTVTTDRVKDKKSSAKSYDQDGKNHEMSKSGEPNVNGDVEKIDSTIENDEPKKGENDVTDSDNEKNEQEIEKIDSTIENDESKKGENDVTDSDNEKNEQEIESEEPKDDNNVTKDNKKEEDNITKDPKKDENDVTKDSNDKIDDKDTSEEKIQDSEISEGRHDESDKIQDIEMSEDKTQDTEENTEMSEEMIETLLKDNGDDGDNSQNCLDIPEDFQEP